MKKWIVLFLVMVLALLAACGEGEAKTDETDSNQEQTSERTITIEDAMGEQTIKGTPKKNSRP